MHQCCHEHCRQQCGPGYASENGKQGANRLWWWTTENCEDILEMGSPAKYAAKYVAKSPAKPMTAVRHVASYYKQ